MSSIETLKALPEKFAVRLDNHMLITLEGEQADSYLQGQITVNVNKLTADHARHYAHCDNKGKTWSVGYVARFNSKIAMITNKASGAHSLAQLNKYGVFSKADIIDESNAHTLWFVSSNTVGDALSHFPPSVVAQEDIDVGSIFLCQHAVGQMLHQTEHRRLDSDVIAAEAHGFGGADLEEAGLEVGEIA